jgi:hypothetical protein
VRLVQPGLTVAVAAVFAATGWLSPMSVGSASADSCPNAVFRTGEGANLPDCRAYELVSPADTNGYDVVFGDQAAAAGGDAVAYASLGAFAGASSAPVSNEYVSTRTVSGWSTVAVSPPLIPSFSLNEAPFEGFSGDLAQMVVQSDESPLDGAMPGTEDLFLRTPEGSFQLLDPTEPLGLTPDVGNEPALGGTSADYSHIVFTSQGSLTPDAPPYDGSDKVYEWVAPGHLALASVLPDGTAADGSLAQPTTSSGLGGAPMLNAVSGDGSRLYWTGGSVIYLRAAGATRQIDLPQCTTNPNCTGGGPDLFWTASTDGSLAFFTSQNQLTDRSTANGNGTGEGDLYEYDASSGRLTDLTVDRLDPAGGDVQGVVGASADGSYVYFVANGRLAEGARSGTCGGGSTGLGACNLYVSHNGTTAFVARLSGADSGMWASQGALALSEHAQVSPDGLHLLFSSVAALAPGFANAGHSEVYLYGAGTGALTCTSCFPAGLAASGDSVLSSPPDSERALLNSPTPPVTALTNMAAEGSLAFFESSQALVPQDTNGSDDVYEWEADGTGACGTAGGCVYLISSGRSGAPSHFLAAGPDGADVFFLTREDLGNEHGDGALALYDARVGGGFPAPAPSSQPCAGDECRAQPAGAPPAVVVASVTFTGPGNPIAGSAAPTAVAKVKVLQGVVHGPAFALRVQVPSRGVISIRGQSIRRVERSLGRAGAYRVRVRLTSRAARALGRGHRLRLVLRIGFKPAGGPGSSITVRLEVVPR